MIDEVNVDVGLSDLCRWLITRRVMITRPTSVLVVGATGSIGRLVVEESSIGVTNRTGAYNRATKAHGRKRRSERLVRVSGDPYTIVRPGWFDYHQPDELRLVLLQGDTRHAGGSPSPDRSGLGTKPGFGRSGSQNV
jgi:hypothetical protein